MGCGSSRSLPVTPENGSSTAAGTLSLNGKQEGLLLDGSVFNSPGEVTIDDEGGVMGGGGINGNKERGGIGSAGTLGSERSGTKGILKNTNQAPFANGNNGLDDDITSRTNSGNRQPLAFEVAAEAPKGESLIKRHPPKKFQKLEEQQPDGSITQELLEEKQAIAEQRRKQILTQRVKSAKTNSVRSAQARARAAESKQLDQLIQDEEQQINNNPTSQQNPPGDLPPLNDTSTRRYHHHPPQNSDNTSHDDLPSPSTRSRASTLSSATTIASTTNLSLTPQQSAHIRRHQIDLQKKFDDEYEQLKQERIKSMEFS